MIRRHRYLFIWAVYFRSLGQKSKNNFVRFLVQMRTRKFAFEIYWPLLFDCCSHCLHVFQCHSISSHAICTYVQESWIIPFNQFFKKIRDLGQQDPRPSLFQKRLFLNLRRFAVTCAMNRFWSVIFFFRFHNMSVG